jgi:hypothetical protein
MTGAGTILRRFQRTIALSRQEGLMKSLYKAIICAACFAFLATAPIAAAQGKLEGVWKITEVTMAGLNARTISNPAPSLFIFTKKHYNLAFATADRPILPRQNATDAQNLAAWTPFSAESGTYEVKGTELTIHPIIAKNTYILKPGSFLTSDIKLQGNTLVLTQKADQDGPKSGTMKLVRVE